MTMCPEAALVEISLGRILFVRRLATVLPRAPAH